jgi:histidinol phosphatase-like PHP family hydrolase
MTLNSDSHHPNQLTYDYDRALAELRAAGFRELAQFNLATKAWQRTPLD